MSDADVLASYQLSLAQCRDALDWKLAELALIEHGHRSVPAADSLLVNRTTLFRMLERGEAVAANPNASLAIGRIAARMIAEKKTRDQAQALLDEMLLEAWLRKTNQNYAEAARRMGVHRNTTWNIRARMLARKGSQ